MGHAAFRVRDLERSKQFYCDVLGLKPAFEMLPDEQGRGHIVYLYIANGQFLELFPAPNAADDFSGGNTGSYRHFQLEVDDLQRTITEIEARGLPRSPNPPRQGRDGNWQYWVTDPDGNRIELMQMASDSLQRQAMERLDGSGR